MSNHICTDSLISPALSSQSQPSRMASVGAEGTCRRADCRRLAGAIQGPFFRRVRAVRPPKESHHSKACIGVHASIIVLPPPYTVKYQKERKGKKGFSMGAILLVKRFASSLDFVGHSQRLHITASCRHWGLKQFPQPMTANLHHPRSPKVTQDAF